MHEDALINPLGEAWRPPLRDLTQPGDILALINAAAQDVRLSGIALVLADHRIPAACLPPALGAEIGEACAYPDGITGPRASGMILRRRIARAVGAALTGAAPESCAILRNQAGAPLFAGPATGLHLSFSARANFGVIGIANSRIGVDIEMPLRDDAIPWNILTPAERKILDALGEARAQAFQRLWAAKEASAKLLGFGFALAPESIALAGWDTGDAIIATHLPGNAPDISSDIRYATYRLDLKFVGSTLEEPPTGGLVVVAARGAHG